MIPLFNSVFFVIIFKFGPTNKFGVSAYGIGMCHFKNICVFVSVFGVPQNYH